MQEQITGTLECVLCAKRYGEESVTALDYFPSTGICFECYSKGKSSVYTNWCFGKPNSLGKRGNVLRFGYSSDSKACREYCPDRKLCALFVSGEMQKWKEEAVQKKPKVDLFSYDGPRLPFYQRSAMTTKAFILCIKGILISDLVHWVRAQGGEPRRVVRIMRSGRFHGKTWTVHESNGYLKIDYKG